MTGNVGLDESGSWARYHGSGNRDQGKMVPDTAGGVDAKVLLMPHASAPE